MSQLVAVSSPASGRELLKRYSSTRAAFFPPPKPQPRITGRPRPKARLVYVTPVIIQRPAVAPQPAEALEREMAAIEALTGKQVEFHTILAEVSSRFCVPVRDIISERRDAGIMLARHVAMFLGRTATVWSFTDIGRLLGGKNHATIIHGCRRIEEMLKAGHPVTADIDAIRARLTA